MNDKYLKAYTEKIEGKRCNECRGLILPFKKIIEVDAYLVFGICRTCWYTKDANENRIRKFYDLQMPYSANVYSKNKLL